MFEIFKKYVGLNDGVISNSPEEFLSSVEGKTFLNGMYRVFNLSEIEKWCKKEGLLILFCYKLF